MQCHFFPPVGTKTAWMNLYNEQVSITHTNTVVVRDFNSPLSPIFRSCRPKINKEILELNDTIDLMDLTDVYREFYPVTG
jgi:hypothetical protein